MTSRPTLRYGDTGSCVKVLQNILLNKGYNIGASYATGNFYSGTELAVRRYQSSKLDLKIDGVVGPATWNRLVNGGGTTYSIHSGPNTSSRVVLSFDDCPKSYSAFQSAVLGAQSLGIALVLAPTGQLHLRRAASARATPGRTGTTSSTTRSATPTSRRCRTRAPATSSGRRVS